MLSNVANSVRENESFRAVVFLQRQSPKEIGECSNNWWMARFKNFHGRPQNPFEFVVVREEDLLLTNPGKFDQMGYRCARSARAVVVSQAAPGIPRIKSNSPGTLTI
jgi:hypothetical protein